MRTCRRCGTTYLIPLCPMCYEIPMPPGASPDTPAGMTAPSERSAEPRAPSPEHRSTERAAEPEANEAG